MKPRVITKTRLQSSGSLTLGALIFLGALASPLHAQVTIETIALSGDAAPGAGVEFGSLSTRLYNVILNDAGQVVFEGTTSDNSCPRGIWASTGLGLQLIACENSPAPDTDAKFQFPGPASTLRSFSRAIISATGEVTFRSLLSNASASEDQGIWLGTPSDVRLLVREGEQASDTPPGTLFNSVGFPGVNNIGQVAFSGSLRGPGVDSSNDSGLWLGEQWGDLALIMREGDPAPGLEDGIAFGPLIDFRGPNDVGEAVVLAELDSSTSGIWLGSPGDLRPVVVTGDPAPEFPEGVRLGPFTTGEINNAGEVAFTADLLNQGDVRPEVILAGPPEALQVIAQAGDPAPDIGGGVQLLFFAGGAPGLNGRGDVGFFSLLEGPGVDGNLFAYFVDHAGTTSLVVREGDQAPGMPPGTRFKNLFDASALYLNQLGDVAFISTATSTFNSGAWVKPRGADLLLIAGPGSQIDVGNGDWRTVVRTGAPQPELPNEGVGNENGLGSILSDCGQVAFSALFTDSSSGVFLASYPRPSSAEVAEDLIDQVQGLGLDTGPSNALTSKLNAALAKLSNDNPNDDNGAAGILRGFIALVEAKTPRDIAEADARRLIRDAEEILDLIDCGL